MGEVVAGRKVSRGDGVRPLRNGGCGRYGACDRSSETGSRDDLLPNVVFDATLDAHGADVRSFPQQIERRVDLVRIGKCLLDAPFPRAIPPYPHKIAMSAARNDQSERNCDLVAFRCVSRISFLNAS